MKTEFKLKSGNILRIMQDENPPNPRLEWDNLGTMVCWHSRYNLGDAEHNSSKRGFAPTHKSTEDMLAFITGQHPDDLYESLMETSDLNSDQAVAESMRISWEDAHKKAVILALRLYDPSGITMSVGSGSHPFDPGDWDSGQVGWIYLTFEHAKKELKVDENDMISEWYGPKKGTLIPLIDVMTRILEGEVKTYNQYLTGDVYGYEIVEIITTNWVNVRDPEDKKTTTEENVLDSCWGFFGDDFKTNGILDHINDELLEEIKN